MSLAKVSLLFVVTLFVYSLNHELIIDKTKAFNSLVSCKIYPCELIFENSFDSSYNVWTYVRGVRDLSLVSNYVCKIDVDRAIHVQL